MKKFFTPILGIAVVAIILTTAPVWINEARAETSCTESGNRTAGFAGMRANASADMSAVPDTAEKKEIEKAKDPYDIHTCPMPSHFHVLKYGPGVCQECNMKLVLVTETKNRPIYVCPMPRCGTATKKPGVCSVCNMKLVEYMPVESVAGRTTLAQNENQKIIKDTMRTVDPYNIHTCPMPSHFHVLIYGPGTCPECDMKLVPVSETKNSPLYVCPMPKCGTVTKEQGRCGVCNMRLIEYETQQNRDDKSH